mgnify:CR=1 FL=1
MHVSLCVWKNDQVHGVHGVHVRERERVQGEEASPSPPTPVKTDHPQWRRHRPLPAVEHDPGQLPDTPALGPPQPSSSNYSITAQRGGIVNANSFYTETLACDSECVTLTGFLRVPKPGFVPIASRPCKRSLLQSWCRWRREFCASGVAGLLWRTHCPCARIRFSPLWCILFVSIASCLRMCCSCCEPPFVLLLSGVCEGKVVVVVVLSLSMA